MLSKIAITVLDMPATSSASERSFSQYCSIHSKKRNRLTSERVEKLLYISHNLKLIEHETTSKEEAQKNASKLAGLSNLVPAAESLKHLQLALPFQMQKKWKRNVEVESDYEGSDFEDSFKFPHDDSSDASLELFLSDDDDDAQ